ncbi:MAG TPA: ABC transporter ATP-binding protein [Burkholderiales bacterium]|nr:ABC transporter ATP-binding protein [Burkholderiales bacterium]
MTGEQDAPVLTARGLTKRFGTLLAVDGVDYTLRQGEVAGIIGSNGAGKSTLFNLLTGYYPPDTGSIYYQGVDVTRAPPQQLVAMGMVRTFQLTSTFDNLSVEDNLVLAHFRAQRRPTLLHLFLNTCARHRGEERIREALETFALAHARSRQVRELSLGEKRRLEIAMAILSGPKVLLLDEPLAGLSESEIRGVLGVLRAQAGRLTLLIVEHKVSQIRDFVQRLTVMHDGRIIAEGSYEECMEHPAVRRSYWQIGAPPEDETEKNPA